MLCTNYIAKILKNVKFEMFRFKVYLFTLQTIRVRVMLLHVFVWKIYDFKL